MSVDPLTGQETSSRSGVDLQLYARVARGIGPYGFDQEKLPQVAAAFGVGVQDWNRAQAGWTARIQADPSIASLFAEYYSTS